MESTGNNVAYCTEKNLKYQKKKYSLLTLTLTLTGNFQNMLVTTPLLQVGTSFFWYREGDVSRGEGWRAGRRGGDANDAVEAWNTNLVILKHHVRGVEHVEATQPAAGTKTRRQKKKETIGRAVCASARPRLKFWGYLCARAICPPHDR